MTLESKKGKKGFTLVELMIVFMVMAVIMAIGVAGLITFRNNLDFESYYSDIQLAVKTAQSNARNSRDVVESTDSNTPEYAEYYILRFTIVSTTTGSGRRNRVTTTKYGYEHTYLPTANTFVQLPLPYEDSSNTANDSLRFTLTEASRILTPDDCGYGIAFKRLTGDLVFLRPYRGAVGEINTGTCVLTLTHNELPGVTRQISFNADNNQITYE